MSHPDVTATGRLRLRRVTPDDAPFLLRLLNQPSWIANIGDRQVRSADDALRYIEHRILPSYCELGFGLYVVELRAEGVLLGLCGLLKRDYLAAPDIGFALLEEHWGCGYAEEAARAVLEHARADLCLSRLLAIVTPTNARSTRLLERLGFARSGVVQVEGESLSLYARDAAPR